MRHLLIILLAWLLPTAAMAQGVVSAADPRAAEAGREILLKGGSAADAAMAMMLALTVVEPQSSGIGGGGFLLYNDAKSGMLGTIDGRETAPAAARPDRFLGADGKPVPFSQAVPGGKSVGVPGNMRLMTKAHAKWGQLKWKELFQPAIRLAERGFLVTPRLANSSANYTPLWLGQNASAARNAPIAGDDSTGAEAAKGFPAIARLYAPRGKPLAVGVRVKNPELARLLRTIAARGPDAFYRGRYAQNLVTAVTRAPANPGDMTLADIAAYEAKERPPVCAPYRGYRICGMGPPSSGATTVFQILGMLERFDLKRLGKDNPVSWHLIGEAMRLAYADRDTYLADPDFVQVPVAGLLDRAYIARRSALISQTRALGRYEPGSPPGAPRYAAVAQPDPQGTTHFVAVDRSGNVATMTSTVESPFGSHLLVNGMVLNNELTDFARVPEKNGVPVANRPQGGKRPLSSMSPTIVYDKDGRPIFTVGAAGGRTIIMQVTKAIIAHLDWGLSAQQSVSEGLIYFNDQGLILEQGTARATLKPALERMGHFVTVGNLGLKANAAARTPSGWEGAADPRSEGIALRD